MKKVKKLERPWTSMSLIYTLPEFSDGLKSRMLKNYDRALRMTQSLKIKANLCCLFVCTFGDYLGPVLIAAHTANNVDFSGEPKDEGYVSEALNKMPFGSP